MSEKTKEIKKIIESWESGKEIKQYHCDFGFCGVFIYPKEPNWDFYMCEYEILD